MSHGRGCTLWRTCARRPARGAGSGGFDADEVMGLSTHWPNTSVFAAPTMVKRLSNASARAIPTTSRPSSAAARRCMSPTRAPPRSLRPALRADLRPGRKSNDHHHLVEAGDCRSRSSALGRTAGLRRPALRLPRSDDRRRRRPRVANRRDWRNFVPRRRGDAGLLEQSGSVGGHVARRLAAYRRRRRVRCRRLSDAEGPFQGRHHFWRLQYLSARGRGNPARAFKRPRGIGDRAARSGMGRGRRRLCGRRRRSRRTRCAVPQRHRAVQTAEGLRVREHTAEKQLRKNPQDRAARARRQEKTRT